MEKTRIISAIAFCLIFSVNFISAQCIYDVTDDGVVNSDDFIFHDAYFGLTVDDLLEGQELVTDHNSNGLSDIMDVIDFVPNVATVDCLEKIEDTDFNCEIVIVEHYVHETELIDYTNIIPAGWITYRMYVLLSEPVMNLNGIYGNSLSPLNIHSSSSLFQWNNLFGEPMGQGLPMTSSTGLAIIFPSILYNSWLTLGWDETDGQGYLPLFFEESEENWINDFLDGNDILINTESGGGLFSPFSSIVPDFYVPNLKLLGQFTTEANSLYGTINLSFERNIPNNQVEIALRTISFGPENIQTLGCTNPLSMEYNPEATYDDGTCSPPGDFNGDGEVTLEDLMVLIGQFGCPIDCEGGDINNDGMVNVADIIAFLEFI